MFVGEWRRSHQPLDLILEPDLFLTLLAVRTDFSFNGRHCVIVATHLIYQA